MPKVSVMMPAYNAEKYIGEAIDSVLSQTFQDFELVIVDDGSTDSTLEVVAQFKDERLVLVKNDKNSGRVAAANCAISKSKGAYLARMDADDVSEPNRLAMQVNYLDRNPSVVVCGSWGYVVGDRDFRICPSSDSDCIKAGMLFQNEFIHSSVVMRAGTLKDYSLAYRSLNADGFAEDYDLLMRLCLLGDVHNIPEFLVGYRRHADQISAVVDGQATILDLAIKLDYFKHNFPGIGVEGVECWRKFLLGNHLEELSSQVSLFATLVRECDSKSVAYRSFMQRKLSAYVTRVLKQGRKRGTKLLEKCSPGSVGLFFDLAYLVGVGKALKFYFKY